MLGWNFKTIYLQRSLSLLVYRDISGIINQKAFVVLCGITYLVLKYLDDSQEHTSVL